MYTDELVYLLHEARPDLFTLDSTVFVSSKASLPPSGQYTFIRETGGSGPARTQNLVHGLPWQGVVPPAAQFPNAQLIFVASTMAEARALADVAYYILINCVNRNVGLATTFYRWIRPLQEPFDFGLDPNKRPRAAFNVQANKNPSLPIPTLLSMSVTPTTHASGGSQTYALTLRYNMWQTVTGTPSIQAVSSDSGQILDQTFTFDSVTNGLGYADVVFKMTGTFVITEDTTLTVDSDSNTTGYDGIVDGVGRPAPEITTQSAVVTITAP